MGKEVYTEAAAILYAPKYSLGNEYHHCIFNMKFLSPHGPARHLRHLRLDCSLFRLGGPTNYPGLFPEHREVGLSDAVPFYESVLRSLAQNARQLETLELALNPKIEHSPVIDRFPVHGNEFHDVPVKPDRSWVGPQLLVGFPEGHSFDRVPPLPTEEQFGRILDFLASGEPAMQRVIRRKIEEGCAPPVVEHRPGELPHSFFWTSLFYFLWMINTERTLWTRVVMDVLRSCSPTLRVVSLVGRVDRKWMAAVADLKGVTVRANTDWLCQAEWVVVEPAGKRDSGERVCED